MSIDEQSVIAAEKIIKAANFNEVYESKKNQIAGFLKVHLSWRRYRQVYVFDEEIIDEILPAGERITMGDVPLASFNNLPYPAVYIDIPSRLPEGTGLYVGYDAEERIFFYCVANLESFCTPVGYQVEDDTIDVEQAMESIMKIGDSEELTIVLRTGLLMALQCMLYLSAMNADIRRTSGTRQQRYQSKKVKAKNTIYDVGRVHGDLIRNIRLNRSQKEKDSTSENNVRRERSSPIPHMRRGHWQHFWTGTRKETNRNLVLKWVSPVIVNGNSDNLRNTINKIRT